MSLFLVWFNVVQYDFNKGYMYIWEIQNDKVYCIKIPIPLKIKQANII